MAEVIGASATPAKILVVDDAPEVRTVLTRMLQKAGHEVITAADGEEALRRAREERPDLLLLDWMLPILDGLEVCRTLKRSPATRGIMVILVTGRGAITSRVEGFDAGADDYVPKPFEHLELLARVRSALRLKRANDELAERNRQLIESQNELVRSEKMATIGLLASGIAHEFNNIMTGISGYAQLAKKNEAHVPQLIDVALTQTARALELTKSLSAYHRRNSQNVATCDLREVIESALKLVRKNLESNRIALEVEIPVDVGHAVISPGQLQDVVLNLVINAIHAIGQEGVIRVAAERVTRSAGEEIVLRVEDSGEGIAPENLERIFDPFFTTKGAFGGGQVLGTGLGLSVTYNAVHSSGGRIHVESELGKGTRFTVTLRAARLGATEAPVRARVDRSPGSVARRLLAIEPDPGAQESIRVTLRDHDVTIVSRAEEALRLCEDRSSAGTSAGFDGVLFSLGDGRLSFEALREIRERATSARLILLTARLPEDLPPEALELADAVVPKPLAREELEAALRESETVLA